MARVTRESAKAVVGERKRVGTILRKAREKAELRIADVVSKTNKSISSLGNYELGKSKIPPDVMKVLMKLYGLKPKDLQLDPAPDYVDDRPKSSGRAPSSMKPSIPIVSGHDGHDEYVTGGEGSEVGRLRRENKKLKQMIVTLLEE